MLGLRVLFATMGRLVGTFWSIYELLRLGVLMRFGFGGGYWRWRMETAFGRGYPASWWELVRSVVEYGRWMHEMRTGKP